jgi:excisionase family DNA binding protein
MKDERERQRRAKLLAELSRAVPHADVADITGSDILLKTGEVALLFGTSDRSVREWANAGKLPCIRTLGGHRLFPAAAVLNAMREAMHQYGEVDVTDKPNGVQSDAHSKGSA